VVGEKEERDLYFELVSKTIQDEFEKIKS